MRAGLRRVCRFLALVCVGGCSSSGREPTLETAYSAIGARVK
jgi:hypothetical protein